MRPPTVRKHYKLSVAPGQGASKYKGDLHKTYITYWIQTDLKILTEKSVNYFWQKLSNEIIKAS